MPGERDPRRSLLIGVAIAVCVLGLLAAIVLYGIYATFSVRQDKVGLGANGGYGFGLCGVVVLDCPMSEALTPEPSTSGAVRRETGTPLVKRGLAEMLKGGVIMDVVNADEARIAEDAGATAVMALERVPSDIRRDGGVARMSDPEMIEGIKAAVTIPVMAKARIGHFVEAQILQSLGVDYIDESEVLTPADEAHHIDKWAFTVPFVCGATNLGEALRRISEGACMIRSKGEAGTGNVVEAVRHLRSILGDIRKIGTADSAELFEWAKQLQRPSAARAGGCRDRQAARADVLRRRHRHPGRRLARHAARRRGRVRGIRHLQELRAGHAWPRPSSRPPPTSATPTSWPR